MIIPKRFELYGATSYIFGDYGRRPHEFYRIADDLLRFEVELAEERRTVAEVSGWLPGFKARLGDAFPHETELEEKRAEMAELDASLAATAPESNAAA